MNKKVALVCPLARTFLFREQLIFELKRKEYDVVLISENGSEIGRFLDAGCKHINIQMDRRGTNIFNDMKLIIDYYNALKKENPDVVLLYTTKCSVYGGIVCRLLKIPYIVNNAGLIESKGYFAILLNILYKMGFSGASCMMYQNDTEKKVLQKLLHNKTHCRRIPGSGVDLKTFSYCEYPDNKEMVIFNYVARIMKSKGIEEYLECAKQMHTKYPNVYFRIYGTLDDGCYREIVKEYVKLGYIEYHGQKKDMKPEIASASAAIHPSHYEGMTNVVLEHSAMGRPCIGSKIPGVADGIDDGVTGFLFEKGNLTSMLDAVEKFILLTHNEKRIMGRSARSFMERYFDRTIVTNAYIEEICEVLKGKTN